MFIMDIFVIIHLKFKNDNNFQKVINKIKY